MRVSLILLISLSLSLSISFSLNLSIFPSINFNKSISYLNVSRRQEVTVSGGCRPAAVVTSEAATGGWRRAEACPARRRKKLSISAALSREAGEEACPLCREQILKEGRIARRFDSTEDDPMASTAAITIVRLTRQTLNQPESDACATARAQIWHALEEHGCFEVIYEGITPELRESVIIAAKELVSLPVETKRKNVASSIGYRGYIGRASGFPYESLAIENVLQPTAALGFANLMWPEGNDSFREAVCSFAEAAAAVEGAVRKMVLQSLGVEKYYDFHMGLTEYQLRLSEYSPQGIDGDLKLALPPHTDNSVSTVSLQSDVNGFEIKTRNGDWMAISPSSPSSLLFINGDVFRAWSNGRLYAPPHRVRVRAGETRQVVLMFAVPEGDPVIEAPPELVDEGTNPVQFRPFRFSEYAEFFKANIKAAYDDPASLLPTFCGTGAAEKTALA